MQSLIKKIAAVIIAIATMLGFAGLGATTALAADTGTITVNTVKGFTGELKLYQMFSATVGANADSDTTDGTKTNVSYTLKNEWQSFFTSAEDGAAGTKFTETDTDTSNALSDKAVKYIQGLSETELANFANVAQKWAADKAIDATKTSSNATNKKTYVFEQLGLGYYLIAPDAGQSANTVDQSYHALLVTLTDAEKNVSIQLKHEFPTIDKTVDDKTAEDKNIGDTVSYKLSSTVAGDMMDYTEGYVFTFHDTLSKGLDLVPNAADDTVTGLTNFAPTVKINNGNALDKDTDYTATATKNTDGTTTITVAMIDIQNKHPEAAGKTITVEYSAKINADAVTGTTGNANSAQIEYSNDPTSNQTGTSVPTEVKVHTFEFTLDKYTGRIYNESSERLGGATFKIYKSDSKPDTTTATALKFNVTAGTGSAATTAKYDANQQAQGLVDTMTTPAYGRIVVSGLAAGIYWIEETAAPDGYNKLADLVKVEIKATYDVNDQGQTDDTHTGKLTSWEISYGDNNKGTGEHPVVPVLNVNKSNLTLPSTGGMGTILFTVFGVLIVALGTAWYVKSNRKTAK
ncbi:surface protein [Bifidobacterium hapali]|uniref:Surface protein n=1 Tax=Bifidobacterium hapali TaxID=1630172 RepID=A0A261G181_9BIFI|nr:SpaH/EbpB family LPXTG-anchored major pilin [Bifidobacterium hapali]OZG65194.1 surface protein [Bifidobacterium hapali]